MACPILYGGHNDPRMAPRHTLSHCRQSPDLKANPCPHSCRWAVRHVKNRPTSRTACDIVFMSLGRTSPFRPGLHRQRTVVLVAGAICQRAPVSWAEPAGCQRRHNRKDERVLRMRHDVISAGPLFARVCTR